MLRVDIAEILRETGKHVDLKFDDMPSADPDITYLEPASGEVTIANTDELLLVRGRFKTVIQMECARCLTEVRELINAEIEEQYTLVGVDHASYDGQATIVPDEENEVPEGLMTGTVIDLNVLIRQAVMLTAPLSTLCSADCLGICAQCGKNKNSGGGCSCAPVARHTPLAALKELYNQKNGRREDAESAEE